MWGLCLGGWWGGLQEPNVWLWERPLQMGYMFSLDTFIPAQRKHENNIDTMAVPKGENIWIGEDGDVDEVKVYPIESYPSVRTMFSKALLTSIEKHSIGTKTSLSDLYFRYEGFKGSDEKMIECDIDNPSMSLDEEAMEKSKSDREQNCKLQLWGSENATPIPFTVTVLDNNTFTYRGFMNSQRDVLDYRKSEGCKAPAYVRQPTDKVEVNEFNSYLERAKENCVVKVSPSYTQCSRNTKYVDECAAVGPFQMMVKGPEKLIYDTFPANGKLSISTVFSLSNSRSYGDSYLGSALKEHCPSSCPHVEILFTPEKFAANIKSLAPKTSVFSKISLLGLEKLTELLEPEEDEEIAEETNNAVVDLLAGIPAVEDGTSTNEVYVAESDSLKPKADLLAGTPAVEDGTSTNEVDVAESDTLTPKAEMTSKPKLKMNPPAVVLFDPMTVVPTHKSAYEGYSSYGRNFVLNGRQNHHVLEACMDVRDRLLKLFIDFNMWMIAFFATDGKFVLHYKMPDSSRSGYSDQILKQLLKVYAKKDVPSINNDAFKASPDSSESETESSIPWVMSKKKKMDDAYNTIREFLNFKKDRSEQNYDEAQYEHAEIFANARTEALDSEVYKYWRRKSFIRIGKYRQR